MADGPTIGFAPFATPTSGVLVVFCDEALRLGPVTRRLIGAAGALVARAAAARCTGKSTSALDLVAPADLKVARLVVVGCGEPGDLKRRDFVKLGGAAMGKIPAAATNATIVAELPNKAMTPEQAADLALGMRLRAYRFDRYKTKRKDGDDKTAAAKVEIGVGDVARTRKVWGERGGMADAVLFTRDLINEPANVLYPVEFARRAGTLKRLGVAVDVFDVAAMKRLGMNALLGVGQGSAHDSRMVIMRWNGGKKD